MNRTHRAAATAISERPSGRTEVEIEIDLFAYFRRITADAFPSYFRAMRGRTQRLEIGEAERFTRNWMRQKIHARGCVLEGQADTLIDRSLSTSGLNGFTLVVAALLAMRLERFDAAETLASKACASDQHETFAQRIQLAARARNQNLRLDVDDWLQDRFCPNPFTTAEIIGSKDVYTCCAAWMPAALGRADETQDVWNSARATEVRRSILDGDFGYCSRVSCPRISGRNLPLRDEAKADALRQKIERDQALPPPRRVLLSYDESCNLSCPSCRSALVSADRHESEALDSFYDDHVSAYLGEATEIKVTGSGDPFGSRHFRNVLRKITAQDADIARLQLQTNGVLFDQRAWDDLGLSGHVKTVWVSVDAAHADTYARLRRDGDFKRLIANLKMLGSLRQKDAFEEFRLDFVVQNDNFDEMEDFVALAREVGADGVHFLQIRNWGTFSPADFRALEVTRRDHPNHARLHDVLARDCFADPFVDLGNLAPIRTTKTPVRKGDTPNTKKLLVLAGARTGTNFLFEILHSFQELQVYAELFNDAGAFGLENDSFAGLNHLIADKGVHFAGERDPKLIQFARNNPLEMLAKLGDLAKQHGKTAFAFKLFPQQIQSTDTLHAILNDPDIIPIIVRRQPLAAFASLLQARQTQVWMNADTTRLKVPFHVPEFQSWYDMHADWYRALGRAFGNNRISPMVMDYEVFSQLSVEQIRNDLAEYLGKYDLQTMPELNIDTTLIRQDRTQNVFDRFEDPDHVKRSLHETAYFSRALKAFEI